MSIRKGQIICSKGFIHCGQYIFLSPFGNVSESSPKPYFVRLRDSTIKSMESAFEDLSKQGFSFSFRFDADKSARRLEAAGAEGARSLTMSSRGDSRHVVVVAATGGLDVIPSRLVTSRGCMASVIWFGCSSNIFLGGGFLRRCGGYK